MEKQKVEIKSIKRLNHDVLAIKTSKPENCNFLPGQATRMAICKEGWYNEDRPYTFTSLPNEKELEFVIKIYPSHNGMTEQLYNLTISDKVSLEKIYGTINYKGKGVFLAGGAGITPFIAILKDLKEKNKLAGNTLVFANKTEEDIFLKDWLAKLLGSAYINILSDEKKQEYLHGKIDKKFFKEYITNYNQYFYVCGPPKMSESIIEDLRELGVEKEYIVAENFGD